MLKSLISISFLLFLIGSSQSLRAQDQEAKVEISSKPNQVMPLTIVWRSIRPPRPSYTNFLRFMPS